MVSIVGSSFAGTTWADTNSVHTFPNLGQQAGDLILAVWQRDRTSGGDAYLTKSAGWQTGWRHQLNQSRYRFEGYWMLLDENTYDDTHTFTFPGGNDYSRYYVVFRGLDQTTPLTIASNAGTSNTAWPTATAVMNNARMLAFHGENANTSPGPSSSYLTQLHYSSPIRWEANLGVYYDNDASELLADDETSPTDIVGTWATWAGHAVVLLNPGSTLAATASFGGLTATAAIGTKVAHPSAAASLGSLAATVNVGITLQTSASAPLGGLVAAISDLGLTLHPFATALLGGLTAGAITGIPVGPSVSAPLGGLSAVVSQPSLLAHPTASAALGGLTASAQLSAFIDNVSASAPLGGLSATAFVYIAIDHPSRGNLVLTTRQVTIQAGTPDERVTVVVNIPRLTFTPIDAPIGVTATPATISVTGASPTISVTR